VTLPAFIRVLRLSWLITLLAFLACVLVGVAIAETATPRYTAHTQLFVSTPSPATNLSDTYQGGLFSQQRVLSYAPVVSSPAVLRPVIQRLHLAMDLASLQRHVHASVPVNTVLIDISVSDGSATRAAAIANAIGVEFPKLVSTLESAKGRALPVKLTVTSRASVPPSPSSPRKKIDLAIAAVLGLALGIGLACLRAFFDTRMRTAADASSAAGTPILGVVASLGRRDRVRMVDDAKAPATMREAYRRIRTNLRARPARGDCKAFVVSSTEAGAGTTSIVANLGITFASAGYSVALVDGDLRNPKLASVLGLSPSIGLTSVLVDEVALPDALQWWGQGNLVTLLASGPVPENPTELLDSLGFATVLKALEQSHDLVIIDSPPLVPYVDAGVIAQLTSQAVLVACLNSTRKDRFAAAVEALRSVDAEILGVVLNRN
jgi:polysaccharide biosynthesis transport protein